MANTKIPAELSSTPGIIDNSNATAITIDSSENVGIGTSADLNANLTVLDTNYTTSSLAGTGLNLRGSSTGNGTYSAALTFTNGYRTGHSAIAGVAENSDNDVMGIAFFTHASTGGTVATSEAMRIDSSGNLLVGTTSTSASVAGGRIFSTGRLVTSVNNEGHYFRRNSSDGAIVDFAKDSTTVGSIGTDTSGNLQTLSSTGNYRFGDSNTTRWSVDVTRMYPMLDATYDIGLTSNRVRNLYLSGGVYLGGTGSANELDDYEEGTWTPDIRRNDGTVSATFNVHNATYVKIGAIVHVKAFINNISAGSSDGSEYWRVNGIPYASDVQSYSAVALAYNTTSANTIYVGDAAGNGVFTQNGSVYAGSLTGQVMFTMTYRAA